MHKSEIVGGGELIEFNTVSFISSPSNDPNHQPRAIQVRRYTLPDFSGTAKAPRKRRLPLSEIQPQNQSNFRIPRLFRGDHSNQKEEVKQIKQEMENERRARESTEVEEMKVERAKGREKLRQRRLDKLNHKQEMKRRWKKANRKIREEEEEVIPTSRGVNEDLTKQVLQKERVSVCVCVCVCVTVYIIRLYIYTYH